MPLLKLFYSLSWPSVLCLDPKDASLLKAQLRSTVKVIFSGHTVHGDLGLDNDFSTISPTETLKFYYFPHSALGGAVLDDSVDSSIKSSFSTEKVESLHRTSLRTRFEKRWWLNPGNETSEVSRVAVLLSGIRKSNMDVGDTFRRFLLPSLVGKKGKMDVNFFLCGAPDWTWIQVDSLWLPVLVSVSNEEETYWKKHLTTQANSNKVRLVRFLVGGKKLVEEIYASPEFEDYVVRKNLDTGSSFPRESQLRGEVFFRTAISFAEKFVNKQFGRLDFCYRASKNLEKGTNNPTPFSHFLRLRPDLWFARPFPPLSLLPPDRVSLRVRSLWTTRVFNTADFRSWDDFGGQDGTALCNNARGREWGGKMRCGFWSQADTEIAVWEKKWEKYLETSSLKPAPPIVPKKLALFDPHVEPSDSRTSTPHESLGSFMTYLKTHGILRCPLFDDQLFVVPQSLADSMFLLGVLDRPGHYARSFNRTVVQKGTLGLDNITNDAIRGSYGELGANHALLRCEGIMGFHTKIGHRDMLRRREGRIGRFEKSLKNRDIAREVWRGHGRNRKGVLYGLNDHEYKTTLIMYARSVPYTIMPFGVMLWKQLKEGRHPTISSGNKLWGSEIKLVLGSNLNQTESGDIQKMMFSHWR